MGMHFAPRPLVGLDSEARGGIGSLAPLCLLHQHESEQYLCCCRLFCERGVPGIREFLLVPWASLPLHWFQGQEEYTKSSPSPVK
jgi:hypothetical protein